MAFAERRSSGVIATVTAGMLCGNYAARSGMSPTTRMAVETFWDYVAFALNSLVFLLIGFEVNLPEVIAVWKPILAAFVAVTLVNHRARLKGRGWFQASSWSSHVTVIDAPTESF